MTNDQIRNQISMIILEVESDWKKELSIVNKVNIDIEDCNKKFGAELSKFDIPPMPKVVTMLQDLLETM